MKKILIADSDREVLGRLWPEFVGDYKVRAATTVEEARRMLRAFQPDLLIRGDFTGRSANEIDPGNTRVIDIPNEGEETPLRIPKQTRDFLVVLRARARNVLSE